MKNFKLKAVRVQELASIVDAIPVKELTTAKDIRLTSNIVKDLLTFIPDLVAASTDLSTKRNDLFKSKGLTDTYKAMSAGLDAETAAELATKMDRDFASEVAVTFKAELDKIKELQEVEVACELGDEKFAKLQEVFEKYTPQMLNRPGATEVTLGAMKTMYLEIADALQVGV